MKEKKEDLVQLEKIINEVLEPVGFIFKRNLWYKYHDEVYTVVRIRRHTIISNFFIDFGFFLKFLNYKKSYDFKATHSDCNFGSLDNEYSAGFRINNPEDASKLQDSLRKNMLPELIRRGNKDYYLHHYLNDKNYRICHPPSSAIHKTILAYVEEINRK